MDNLLLWIMENDFDTVVAVYCLSNFGLLRCSRAQKWQPCRGKAWIGNHLKTSPVNFAVTQMLQLINSKFM